MGKKHYNYIKDRLYWDSTSEIDRCVSTSSCYDSSSYINSQFIISTSHSPSIDNCKHLYSSAVGTVSNKYIFDMWVTTIIFTCLIIVCDIGLAIFGFLLFKSDGSGL